MDEAEKAKLREINGKDFRAAEIARYYGKKFVDCVHCQLMKYGVFVIPGETRWECQRCGRCCTGMEGKLKLNIPGLVFDKDGVCEKFDKVSGLCLNHDNKPWQCKIWPFYGTYDSETHPEVLVVVSSLCTGLGKGEVITDEVYNRLVEYLRNPKQIQKAFERC
jgi:Fe-S-cluster containining protein